MKYTRWAALLLAAVVMLGSLAACGKAAQGDPVDAPTTVTTTTTTAAPVWYVTADVLNVRKGPGGEHQVIGSLTYGTVVEILAEEEGWCRILYEGQEAYVSADYVSQQTAASAATTTTTEVTTTTTTTSKPTTQSPTYDDRYIDENGMLQFEAGDHYVQAKSYGSAAIPWNLLLVNDWNPMKEGYDESVTMKKLDTKYAQVNGNQRVDARMYEDLIAMLEAGKAYNIGVQSSYRPYAKQKELYWRQVDKWKNTYSDPVELQSKAGEVVKRPGYSEHNTGLAVDLYGSGDTSLSPSFANTAAYKWLMEHCADYGFILRFPKGKEAITGVIYEAWHFRYVGNPDVAHKIMDAGLCLEEYLAQVQQ